MAPTFWMAVIREHFASKGLGLPAQRLAERAFDLGKPAAGHNARRYGRDDQKAMIEGCDHRKVPASPLASPNPSTARIATHMSPRRAGPTRDGRLGGSSQARRCGPRMHVATHCALLARTSGNDGDARGITCFLVPAKDKRREVEDICDLQYATDHPRVSFTDVFVPDDALFGEIGAGCRWRSVSCMRTGSGRPRSSLGAAGTASRKA